MISAWRTVHTKHTQLLLTAENQDRKIASTDEGGVRKDWGCFFHHEQNHNMTKPLHVLGAHNNRTYNRKHDVNCKAGTNSSTHSTITS